MRWQQCRGTPAKARSLPLLCRNTSKEMTTVLNPGGPGEAVSSSQADGAQMPSMQRSASQQMLIGQGEPEAPSMLIPVSATAAIPAPPGNMLPTMMLQTQGMTIEQVGYGYHHQHGTGACHGRKAHPGESSDHSAATHPHSCSLGPPGCCPRPNWLCVV